SGQVDLNWAKEHHALWVDEVRSGGKTQPQAQPAE
ncbi:MAG: formate dehydrogenase subunit gamma, partial [Bacteroidota bacterium]